MGDRIEQIGNSLIQHGKQSDRVYLMKLAAGDDPADVVRQLNELACRHDYSKIFAKIPGSAEAAFSQAGYVVEARVPGLFGGTEEGLFASRFVDPRRAEETEAERHNAVLRTAQQKAAGGNDSQIAADLSWRICTETDVEAMADVYREVFESLSVPDRRGAVSA